MIDAQAYAKTFETAFNTGASVAITALFDPAAVDHAPWPGQTPDVAGFAAGLSEMRAAFPDLRANVLQTVAEGDRIAVQARISGTHLGPFMAAPASGKTFSVEVFDILRLKEGRIAEHWGVIDVPAMMSQLGR